MLFAALTTELITKERHLDYDMWWCDHLLPERTKARYPMADTWPDCLQGLLEPSGKNTTGCCSLEIIGVRRMSCFDMVTCQAQIESQICRNTFLICPPAPYHLSSLSLVPLFDALKTQINLVSKFLFLCVLTWNLLMYKDCEIRLHWVSSGRLFEET